MEINTAAATLTYTLIRYYPPMVLADADFTAENATLHEPCRLHPVSSISEFFPFLTHQNSIKQTPT